MTPKTRAKKTCSPALRFNCDIPYVDESHRQSSFLKQSRLRPTFLPERLIDNFSYEVRRLATSVFWHKGRLRAPKALRGGTREMLGIKAGHIDPRRVEREVESRLHLIRPHCSYLHGIGTNTGLQRSNVRKANRIAIHTTLADDTSALTMSAAASEMIPDGTLHTANRQSGVIKPPLNREELPTRRCSAERTGSHRHRHFSALSDRYERPTEQRYHRCTHGHKRRESERATVNRTTAGDKQ